MSRRHLGSLDDPALSAAFDEAAGWLTSHVRAGRARLGLTQAQLAERAGVDLTYIARLESPSASVNVTLRLLVALGRALECAPHTLITPAPVPESVRPGRPRRVRE